MPQFNQFKKYCSVLTPSLPLSSLPLLPLSPSLVLTKFSINMSVTSDLVWEGHVTLGNQFESSRASTGSIFLSTCISDRQLVVTTLKYTCWWF